jgi:hypothetical protein
MRVIVKQRSRLDEIVYAHYGDLNHFTEVLDLNKITEVYLEVGESVELPEYEEEEVYYENGGLW